MKKIVITLMIVSVIILTIVFIAKKNSHDILKGNWIATVENQRIHQIGPNNGTRGGKEDYYLECDGNGKYSLRTKTEDLANASYIVSENIATFYDEGRQILAICKCNNNELECNEKSYYAFKYTKVDD